MVSGSRIEAVGKTAPLRSRFPEADETDLTGHIVMPGLIDTHVHLAKRCCGACRKESAYRTSPAGCSDASSPAGSYTEDDARASAQLAVLEMIKSGTTGFIECLLAERYGFDGIAEACVESGDQGRSRQGGHGGQPRRPRPIGWHSGMWQSRESSIEQTLAAHERWEGAGEGRLQVWFGCRSAEPVCDLSLYDEVSELAQGPRHGHHHPSGRAARRQRLRPPPRVPQPRRAGSQPRPAGASDGAGPLHCGQRRRPSAPGRHLHLGVAQPGQQRLCGLGSGPGGRHARSRGQRRPRLRRRASNANLDLLRDLRIACHSARQLAGTRLALGAETALEMATLNGSPGARRRRLARIAGTRARRRTSSPSTPTPRICSPCGIRWPLRCSRRRAETWTRW